MSRLWRGRAAGGARVVITALGVGGAPIRQLRAEIPDDVAIRILLPFGTASVTLQGTTQDARVRVELGRHRPRRGRRR